LKARASEIEVVERGEVCDEDEAEVEGEPVVANEREN
jgi:hypothetical protein